MAGGAAAGARCDRGRVRRGLPEWLRVGWNVIALSAGPAAFGFGLYLLVVAAWWEGVTAIVAAPFFALALMAAATVADSLQLTPQVEAHRGGLGADLILLQEARGVVGGKARPNA